MINWRVESYVTHGLWLQIEFSPSVEDVVGFVVSVPATLIATISHIKRLPERIKIGGKHKPLVRQREKERGIYYLFLQPIHKVIEGDEEVNKIKAAIESTMTATAYKLSDEYPLEWKE